MRSCAIFLVSLAIFTGCAHREPMPPATPLGATKIPQTQTTLYFGLNRPDGSMLSAQDWDNFVNDEIAPRFPDGFTILTGEGEWRSNDANKREPSKVVIIVHPDTKFHSELCDTVRERYKSLFHQESVLRVDQKPRVVAF